MTLMLSRRRLSQRLWGLAATLVVALAPAQACAQEPVKLKYGMPAFPSLDMITVVMKDRGFDRKHGIDMDLRPYGAISAMYAAVASGETDGMFGGPLVFQKMRLEGVPLKIVGTMVDMAALALITKDPSIRSVTDLKGKTIAADMGSAQYSVINVYARHKGLVFGKDVTVVQAGPPLVRTQLAAGRVDAGMSWEPTLTMTLRENPEYRVILNAKQGWHELTGKDGWLLSLGLREDWLAKHGAALPRLIAAYDEAARFLRSSPDEADRILQGAMKLPAGTVKEMVSAARVGFMPRATTDAAARDTLWEIIKVGIAEDYFKAPVKDQSIFYQR